VRASNASIIATIEPVLATFLAILFLRLSRLGRDYGLLGKKFLITD